MFKMTDAKQQVNPGTLLTCNDCKLSFKYNVVLKMHNSSVHKATKKRSFIRSCILCEMKFNSKISLVFHKSKEHNYYTKPSKGLRSGFCPECKTNQLCILDHMNRVHLFPQIKCTRCNFETRNKHTLNMHFNSRHTDSMKKQCTSCGQIFKYLKRHFTNTSCGKGLQNSLKTLLVNNVENYYQERVLPDIFQLYTTR